MWFDMGAGMSCMNETGANGNRVSVENDGTIYHEKQSKEMCALHALNNLFQDDKAYTKKDLDDICYKMSPLTYINPHKSMFGLGNYDINVIMAALQKKNFDTVWFDKRKDIGRLVLDVIEGFILNIPTDYKLGMVKFPLKRKHWIAIRQVGQHYYNLDSKLDAPEVIGGCSELTQYLRDQVRSCEKELLLVVKSEVAQEGSWYNKDDIPSEQNTPTEDQKVDVDVRISEVHSESETKENGELPSEQTASLKVTCKPAPGGLNFNGDLRRSPSPGSKYEVRSCDRKNSDVEITSHS